MQLIKSLAAYASLLAVLVLQGCSILHDPRDAPWDPKRGQALHEQFPNWRNEGMIRCGGHLKPEQRAQGMSDRC